MSSQIEIPLPLNGLGESAVGGKNTTPSCMNVRPRADGTLGSRPGLVRPYGVPLAPTAVQWVGQMDCGYGDSVAYHDGFDYADGPLVAAAGSPWTGADPNLLVSGGAVLDVGTLGSKFSAGEYMGFAGDQWDDFVLESQLQWSYVTSFSVEFWVGGDALGNGGIHIAINNVSRPILPSLAFTNDLSIVTTSPSMGFWTTSFGPFYGNAGGSLRVCADSASVQVWWNSQLVLTQPRVNGTCLSAGFTMTRSNPGSANGIADSVPQVQLLDWRLTTASRAQAITRKLLAVAGGNVWAEQSAGVLAPSPLNAQPMAPDRLISAAACGGVLFLADGVSPRFANPSARGVQCQPYIARKGLLPASAGLAAGWRNRVVLAGLPADPQNYYMSRQGDPWDFELDASDAAAATSGDGGAGKPAEPILALCPLGEEVLVLGCTRSLWVLRGDPLHGGVVQRRVDPMGIAGPNAWAVDTGGNFYFLSDEGLFVMDAVANTPPKCLSRIAALQGRRAVQAGATPAEGEVYASLAFDASRNGLLVFLTPVGGAIGQHWFFDIARGAIFPESYPAAAGPIFAAGCSGESPAIAALVLGGADGWLYGFDDAAKSDAVGDPPGAAIASSLTIAAELPRDPMAQAVLSGLELTLSPASGPVQLDVRTGDTLGAALAAAPQAGGTCTGGRNVHRFRVRGRRHLVRLANTAAGVAWSLESAAARSAGQGAL